MSQAQARTQVPSVGDTLKHHRLEKNLSVTQVAERLRLDPRVIEALERNDYSSLPAALYVRGYLRSYSRLLNIDAEAVIARFNNDSPTEPPEIIPEVRHPTQTSSSDRPIKAISYLLSFTLVILIIAWWQSNFVVRRDDFTAGGHENTQAQPPPGLPYPITIVRHPDSPFYRAPIEEPEESGAGMEATAGALSETGAVVIERGPPGPDRIVMRLSADSWIEVFDANGEKVFVSLARAGQVLSLTGTAPFSVLLGFAQGVSIEINGKPFESGAYSRSGIARFTLDD